MAIFFNISPRHEIFVQLFHPPGEGGPGQGAVHAAADVERVAGRRGPGGRRHVRARRYRYAMIYF